MFALLGNHGLKMGAVLKESLKGMEYLNPATLLQTQHTSQALVIVQEEKRGKERVCTGTNSHCGWGAAGN